MVDHQSPRLTMMAGNLSIPGEPTFIGSEAARLPYLPTTDLRMDILNAIHASEQRINNRLSEIVTAVDQRFTTVGDHFNMIEGRFNRIDESINVRFASTDEALQTMNRNLGTCDQRISTYAQQAEHGFAFLMGRGSSAGNHSGMVNNGFDQLQQGLREMQQYLNTVDTRFDKCEQIIMDLTLRQEAQYAQYPTFLVIFSFFHFFFQIVANSCTQIF